MVMIYLFVQGNNHFKKKFIQNCKYAKFFSDWNDKEMCKCAKVKGYNPLSLLFKLKFAPTIDA